MKGRRWRDAAALAAALCASSPSSAGAVIDPDRIDVKEHLSAPVPLDLSFVDQDGRPVLLRDYFDGTRPVALVLAYYDCPMLCGLVLRATATALANLQWTPGQQYRVLTVSFNPDDTPAKARATRSTALLQLGGDKQNSAVWPFLTGKAGDIERLAAALGFTAIRDENGQYAHPAVLFILTPQGKISRYLYGINFSPLDIRLGLLEASQGRIGTTADHVLMRCYAFDPASRRYGLYVRGMTQVFGAIVLIAFGVMYLAIHRVRRRREERAP